LSELVATIKQLKVKVVSLALKVGREQGLDLSDKFLTMKPALDFESYAVL